MPVPTPSTSSPDQDALLDAHRAGAHEQGAVGCLSCAHEDHDNYIPGCAGCASRYGESL